MSLHTKGPWTLYESWDATPHRIFLRRELGVIAVPHYGYTDPTGEIAQEMLANARRIVACVNACEGLSPESLESFAKHKGGTS